MNYYPQRRSARLSGYDYTTPGAYFITICIQEKKCLLGNIIDAKIVLNQYGEIVSACWNDLPDHYINVELGEFVVMPNHVHGIIILTDANARVGKPERAGLRPAPTIGESVQNSHPASIKKIHGLPEIIRAFKSFSSRRINEVRNLPGVRLWQKNYYEHVIRNEDE